MRKWYVQNMMVFSKKEKIRKMTDNLMKIELLDNSQISNDRKNTAPPPEAFSWLPLLAYYGESKKANI